ncbi:MAG: beta-galactosidase [Chloroflexi bacterium]|nr:beta-galactosidase [Chloroflexota bacterium]
MENSTLGRLFQKLWHGADYTYEQWLDSPDILADDLRLMKEAHCNVMSVGMFGWVLLEPEEGQYNFSWLDRLMDELAVHDIAAMLGTPSASPPVWLSKKYPETRRVNAQGQRQPHKVRQNFCYTSPIYREKVHNINRMLAERYQNHPALLLWHVSNEYGGYGGVQCHCDLCYSAFKEWLKARYTSLDALNHAWWTTFWGNRYSDWDQIEPVDEHGHGLMLDWKRFMSDQALEFYKAETGPLREITPNIPITTNFMRPDASLDYWRFAEHVDVISWDNYPLWHHGDDEAAAIETSFFHDLHRSYKQGLPFLMLESTPSVTNWQGVSRLKQPGMHKLSSLQAVAHGGNSVQYFQWRQSRGGWEKFHGAVITHLNTPDTRVFREVSDVGTTLEELSAIASSTNKAAVAMLYDLENGWALNNAQIPRSIGKQYQETCYAHYATFWRQGVTVDVVNGAADLSGYKLVIAPMLYMMQAGLAEQIEAFVQAGGVFVTTYLSGMVDETDLCFLNGYPPALRRTLGIYVEEIDALTDPQQGTITFREGNDLQVSGSYAFRQYAELIHLETAASVAEYASEFYAGSPAITVNAHGSGKAYFMAARTDKALLQDFYGAIIKSENLRRAIQPKLPSGVTAQVRENDKQRFVFLMNFTNEKKHVELGEDSFTDAETGSAVGQSIMLEGYGIRILEASINS